VEAIGGRSIHPMNATIGGMRKAPEIEELKKVLNDFRNTFDIVLRLADLFLQLKYPDFIRKTSYISLSNSDEYAIYDGKIMVDGKLDLNPKEFLLLIKEFQEKDSVAKRVKFADNTYMVGALARLHNNQEKLNPSAKAVLEKSKIKFPFYNPFYNILAQAIELVHCFEEAIKLLELITIGEIEISEPKIDSQTGEGVGAIEAPRGTLFYDLKLKQGIVENLNIITPTAQNLANLEADLEEFEKLAGFDRLNREQREEKIKMLIRAYDPCVTCAVH
jgi:coenzyme F420-reducing hydrogenase alpha subunit